MEKNHKFWIEDGKLISKPATQNELQQFRDNCDNNKWMVIGRSCFDCNRAHYHLIDMEYLNCFACGRFFRKGIDITIYDEENENKEGSE